MDPPAPATVADPLGLVALSHPERHVLSQEMHLRRLPPIAPPTHLLQVLVLIGEAEAGTLRELIAALAAPGVHPLSGDARHALFELRGMRGVWERHAEFATLTFIRDGLPEDAFDPTPFVAARPLLDRLPAAVIRATLVAIAPARDEARLEAHAMRRFASEELVKCDLLGGRARIWSSFRLDEDGLGRLLIVDRALRGEEPMQLVQRIQELGNYRNMALLGLPLARRIAPELATVERRLAALTAQVAEPDSADAPLLEELTALAATLSSLLVEARYRMSATEAYAKIVEERLAWLDDTPLNGHRTLTDFTDRRLMPAVRTCATITQRMERLSQDAARTSALLRTRIDTALARQNRDLLGSMDRRTHLQLRLQQAVEGLSVVAISYYLVSLLGEAVRPFVHERHDLIVAAAVPIVMLLVFAQLVRLRRGLEE